MSSWGGNVRLSFHVFYVLVLVWILVWLCYCVTAVTVMPLLLYHLCGSVDVVEGLYFLLPRLLYHLCRCNLWCYVYSIPYSFLPKASTFGITKTETEFVFTCLEEFGSHVLKLLLTILYITVCSALWQCYFMLAAIRTIFALFIFYGFLLVYLLFGFFTLGVIWCIPRPVNLVVWSLLW